MEQGIYPALRFIHDLYLMATHKTSKANAAKLGRAFLVSEWELRVKLINGFNVTFCDMI
jgi:hypothetical protein